MTMRDLELFLMIADEKSFTRAAERMFISQSAVTQHIKKTESELGFPLFRRNKHSVELTVQGEIMKKAAGSVLNTYHQAVADALRSCASHETLHIGYVGHMNLHMLPEAMKRFYERFPDCGVLTERVRPDQISPLLERGVLRMIMTPYDLVENSPDLLFYPVCHDRHYCVMNANCPLAQKSHLTYRDLAGYTILIPAKEYCPKHMSLAVEQLKALDPDCRFELGINADNVIFQLMASKTKLAMMPGYTRPSHSELASVPLENGIEVRVGIAYSNSLDPSEKAFLSCAVEMLGR
ncbi:MAG: LysR family transcriptional regulator [Oscillospiraceae bacterium]|nr:LysR family transcriptional regulator [Oscillospiraceae bacterium]